MEREGFVFYKSFWNAVKNMDDKTFKECVSAICLYAIEGYEGDPEGMAGTVLELVKPQIDANNKRYESGKRGGAPAGNNNARKNKENNQKQPVVEYETTKNNQKQPKDKVKDKVKVKDKEKEKEKVLLDALSDFSGLLQETIKDWMAYKAERGESYKSVVGLKNWLGQIRNYRERYSDKSIAAVISRTMGCGYQGVVWDWLKDEPLKPKEYSPPPELNPDDMLSPEEQEAVVKEMNERIGGLFGKK